jgi:glycosyltransferase involved in cell wall biosynthesis
MSSRPFAGSFNVPTSRRPAVLMIAYTNYENDPRVIRAAEAAVEAKYDVDFLALRRAGQPAVEMIRGVRVHRLPQERYRGRSRIGYLTAYLTFFLRCVVASGRMHVAKRYKVVHVNNMPDVLVFSAIIPKLLGAGVILDIHDPMPETFGSKFVGAKQGGFFRLLVFLERMSVRFADRTITVNEPVRDSVLLTHGYRAEEIDVIANFADDQIFTLLPPAPVDSVVRFVFHGTILERYGLRTLIQAVAKVRHRARMQIRLIGEGDFSAGLKDLIASHGVGDVVDFRNRVYPLHDIPRQLSDCHVGLVPLDVTSITNFALPLKLIEYTCLGLPSITVRSTAIEHYLRPDECMFYEAGNADSLAAVLDEVAANPDRLPEFRRRLAVPRERMSWTREKDRYIGILRTLSGEAAAAPAPSLAGKQP